MLLYINIKHLSLSVQLRGDHRDRENGEEKGAGHYRSAEGINESDRSHPSSFVTRWVNFHSWRETVLLCFLFYATLNSAISFFFHQYYKFPRVPSVVATRLQYRDIAKVREKKETACALSCVSPVMSRNPLPASKRRKIM